MTTFGLPLPKSKSTTATSAEPGEILGVDPQLVTLFVGLDLAPHDGLETGFAAMTRERELLRLDKLGTDDDILRVLESMTLPENTMILLDVPKNLSVTSKWQLEEMKLHPNRLLRERSLGADEAETPVPPDTPLQPPRGNPHFMSRWERLNRHANRTGELYDQLVAQGYGVMLYYSDQARLKYGIQVPFKMRSSSGSRAFHTALNAILKFKNAPTQPPAVSIMEAMLGAWLAWSTWAGNPGEHWRLHYDDDNRRRYEPTAVCLRLPKSTR